MMPTGHRKYATTDIDTGLDKHLSVTQYGSLMEDLATNRGETY